MPSALYLNAAGPGNDRKILFTVVFWKPLALGDRYLFMTQQHRQRIYYVGRGWAAVAILSLLCGLGSWLRLPASQALPSGPSEQEACFVVTHPGLPTAALICEAQQAWFALGDPCAQRLALLKVAPCETVALSDQAGCPVSVIHKTPAATRLLCGRGLNPNSDSAADLEELPGVGPSRARAIVEDRILNGPFESAADLIRVRGIGPKTAASAAPYLELPTQD